MVNQLEYKSENRQEKYLPFFIFCERTTTLPSEVAEGSEFILILS